MGECGFFLQVKFATSQYALLAGDNLFILAGTMRVVSLGGRGETGSLYVLS